MNINVINDEYFENPIMSIDPIKNTIMMATFIREYELMQEYYDLEGKYTNWVVDSCCPDYDGDVTKEMADGWRARIQEIIKELDSFLDGTGITKEEYEEAKKNLR